jgi:hypothetical protein
MKRILGALALATLAGCGSGGRDPIVQAAIEEFGGFWQREDRLPAEPAQPITRAQIEAQDVAAIFARLEGDPTPTLLYGASANGPYVTFLSPLRQSVTLRGSQVTGTRGLGADLLSAWSSSPDPLARAIPPGSWPAGVRRSYELPADAPQGQILSYDCRFERGPLREMTILQVRHVGVEFAEICTGPAGSFENLHFADAQSGFVWRTLQWTGPEMELLDVQIAEPYTGG